MTLNLTIASRRFIYQCSDFCLTDTATRQEVAGTNKAIHVTNSTFSALITYTGIGRANRIDTVDLLENWLAQIGDVSLQSLRDELLFRTQHWIAGLGLDPRSKLPWRHTFVVAAFTSVDSKAQVTVISNFESAHVEQRITSPTFSQHTVEVGDRPLVLVTGEKRAVPREVRRRLQHEVRKKLDQPAVVRRVLIECNVAAAKHRKFGSVISEACHVANLNSDGSGQDLVSGEAAGMLRSVGFGVSLSKFDSILPELNNAVIGASSFVAISELSTTTLPILHCSPLPRGLSDSDYSMVELVESSPKGGFPDARCRAINDYGLIVIDAARTGRDSSREYCVCRDGATYEALGIQGPNGGGPVTVDSLGRIAGGAAIGADPLAAFVLASGEVNVLKPAGRARAITSIRGSMAAGWVSLGGESRGQLDYRPSIWNLDETNPEPSIASNIPGDWATAVQLLEDGSVLIQTHGPGWFTSKPALLLADASIIEIGDSGGSIMPIVRMNGRTLGSTPTSAGERLAVIHEEATGWRPLGTPPGFVPVSMNQVNVVIGHVQVADGERPWVLRPGGSLVMLPYYRDHICRPTSINRAGILVGAAVTDHGNHALVWAPGTMDK